MKTKHTKIVFAFMAVWMLGYFHHFFATRSHINEIEAQNVQLEQKLQELAARVQSIKKVTVKTTAYSNDDYSINVPAWRDQRTATNKHVKRGMIAADWRLFPPGTRIYVPGYGEAVVEDRGGAVKGYHLDLFVDTYKEARKWGVRNMDVYVIKMGSSDKT
jgi:3D (Asp-Asp-Asp) domain-containing protein